MDHDVAAPGPAAIGRAVAATVGRSALVVTVVLLFYYWAPLDRPLDEVTGVLLAAVPVVLALALAFAVRTVVRSPRPRLQALRALSVGVPMLLIVFAAIYCIIDAGQPDAFTERLSRTDALYFTVTVFATVGFGDITPVTELARILVTLQMVLGLLTVGVVVKLLFGAANVAKARRTHTPTEEPN